MVQWMDGCDFVFSSVLIELHINLNWIGEYCMQAVTLHITAFTIITVPYNSISRKLEVNSLVSLVGGDLERLASSKLARLAPLCGLGGLAWEFPRVWVTLV
ncbi:hypothetical protein FOCG_05616 [Fusarium oxysporum f. sp. radicis-lycopersici 26381]|jgi:hypothetical protein|uniref:Uncharacterized protein n=6 Tax=Fusarium oxysporum TaxID=5507 RepID=W9HVJ9_FUSOX|nr:hypothetical protein FOXG_21271 [Fusarium oxysporum f. sp. lycopersici 4287]EWY84834.1 hypothetical protein FOYG_12205 [Fusarium oxysporum NRRL 32931]EWZ35283.1 hypothetical protein FOZG_11281 [Fusarium oxysporum Fo47]EWZ96724.1 hypothetical protein FOWG_04005 [Fusarium oxysporum f. sp. lycopersici MN25]EXA37407.1 hypothetical protein FOVG_11633 [Fusarium oxysporum f. sp. pisi HDV247]EXK34947.1 hypothetical protein FOMG_10256 [Fusarium oxysporum f. sp. melonis 26406]EXL54819.1 hypothetical